MTSRQQQLTATGVRILLQLPVLVAVADVAVDGVDADVIARRLVTADCPQPCAVGRNRACTSIRQRQNDILSCIKPPLIEQTLSTASSVLFSGQLTSEEGQKYDCLKHVSVFLAALLKTL